MAEDWHRFYITTKTCQAPAGQFSLPARLRGQKERKEMMTVKIKLTKNPSGSCGDPKQGQIYKYYVQLFS